MTSDIEAWLKIRRIQVATWRLEIATTTVRQATLDLKAAMAIGAPADEIEVLRDRLETQVTEAQRVCAVTSASD